MESLIGDATTTFLSTTGFELSAVVTWAGDLIKLFLGSGLALVDELKGWIIALIMIGAVLGLIYKALRFFHVLR